MHPGERRVPVEAHADVGVAAQRRPHLGARASSTTPARPTRSPRTSATTTSSAATRRSATSCPRDVASRAAKLEVDAGRGVGPLKNGVYLDFGRAIERLGASVDRGALRQPLRDVRAHHRRGPVRGRRCASTPPSTTRWAGSGWTTSCSRRSPGCFVAGEANFSDHGANRLGASALMQGLADGYFVLPYTMPQLPRRHARRSRRCPTDDPAFSEAEAERARPDATGSCRSAAPRSVDHFHRELGKIMWDNCGMARSRGEPREGALARSRRCARSSRRTSGCSARPTTLNQSLEKAGRVADFFELGRADVPRRPAPRGELRRPLPGRAPDRGRRGAARRRPVRLRRGVGVDAATPSSPTLHKEPLEFEYVKLAPEVVQVTRRRSNLTLKVWRQAGPDDAGRAEDLRRARHQRGHVVPRDARRPQRPAHRRGRGADRLRARLPRGHLRLVRDDDQRPGPRPAAGHGHLPAAHAQVQRRRRDHRRAVAGRRLPGREGPRRQPLGVRPHRRGRRLHPRQRRRRARGQPHPGARRTAADAALDAAACIGCGACVAACPNGAAQLFTSAKVAHLNLLPQGQAERYRGSRRWSTRWRSTSAPAPTTASARRRARSRSRSTSSR